MKRQIKSANTFINSSQHLQHLLQSSREHQQLLQRVRGLLGPHMANHCLSAQLVSGTLTLTADSSVWASRLRFQSRQLLDHLRADALSADKILVRVIPPVHQTLRRKQPTAAKKISPATAKYLAETAETIDDPALQAALRRLARSASRES